MCVCVCYLICSSKWMEMYNNSGIRSPITVGWSTPLDSRQKKGIFFFFVKNTHKKERKEKKKQKKRAPTPIIIRIANDKIRKNIETKIRPFFLVAKKNVL